MRRLPKIVICRDISIEHKNPCAQATVFPVDRSRIVYGRLIAGRRTHQLLYQQGRAYGQVGDMCEYLSEEDLTHLEREGTIRIIGQRPGLVPHSAEVQ